MQGQVLIKTSGSPNGFKLSSLQKIDTICSGLSEINISKNVEQIDLIVFNRCARLTFEVDEENAKILPELYDVFEIDGEEYPVPFYLYKE